MFQLLILLEPLTTCIVSTCRIENTYGEINSHQCNCIGGYIATYSSSNNRHEQRHTTWINLAVLSNGRCNWVSVRSIRVPSGFLTLVVIFRYFIRPLFLLLLGLLCQRKLDITLQMHRLLLFSKVRFLAFFIG